MKIRALLATGAACALLCAREPARAKHAMVVAQEPYAADVGVAVLKAGGNAVDAAVAVGFTLAVTYPYAGNIGGGGFMLIRMADGRTAFIDFREKAPAAATRNMYLDASGKPTRDSIVGWRASGVPGSVRGFEYANKKFGQKTWAEVIDPAVDLAAKGFPVSYPFYQSLAPDGRTAKLMAAYPDSKRIFLGHEIGDNFVQPELAATLTRIRDRGANDFYEGETAHKLAAAMKENGGLITLDDLHNYKAEERKPLTGSYHGYEIITSPPPSSGGLGLLQITAMLDGTGYEKAGAGSAAAIHYVAECERRYFADRSEFMGDPDFYKNPIKQLLDPAYIASRRATIDPKRATPSDEIKHGDIKVHESTETTHYSIVDAAGNAVAVTYTLNAGYGNGITVPGLGFLLNDEMDDFASKPGEPNMFGLVQGESNAIQPGKRPLSSMMPTIAVKDGKLAMVLGAPGGSRIITAVTEVFLNIVDFHMGPQDANDWPRFHHQWRPDRLELQPGISPDTVAILKQMGHNVDFAKPLEGAKVEAVFVENGWLAGSSDGRGNGKAAGY